MIWIVYCPVCQADVEWDDEKHLTYPFIIHEIPPHPEAKPILYLKEEGEEWAELCAHRRQ